MKFTISESVFSRLSNYTVGVLILDGLSQNEHDQAALSDLTAKLINEAKPHSSSDERITDWQTAFKAAGVSGDVKPAHQTLLERLQKTGSLPNVLPLVNLTNALSVKHLVPIGTHTLDMLDGDLEARLTENSDSFIPINATQREQIPAGELALTSDNTILTRNLVWRQGETSKITDHSRSVAILIDAVGSQAEEVVQKVLNEIKTAISVVFGITESKSSILSLSNPEFSWTDTSNPEEKKQNQKLHSVLTRGVSEVLPSKDGLAAIMHKKKIRVFLGIDPTGSLLTLGHSVVLRKLQQFADLGQEVILLIGSGTVRIGDPTGKDSTRPELTDEQIQANFKNWKEQASKILDFDKIKIVYNGDWLDELTYADLVKLMAKTTVQQLIERDMFQDRLKNGKPIFGHEIMYPLLQGYDSVHMDVDLEIGGTDQTFNMMMGRHLQKAYNNHEKWVLTTPIINGTDGRKMSKSYGNFVAITEEPRQMYGKLMSIADDMILEYFTLLTDTPETDLATIAANMAAGDNPMEFKKRLAFTITEQYHTTAAATDAAEFFTSTVQNKSVPDDVLEVQLESSDKTALDVLKRAVPERSNTELRRLVEQGAVTILPGDQKITDATQELDIADGTVIKIGKRRFVKLRK